MTLNTIVDVLIIWKLNPKILFGVSSVPLDVEFYGVCNEPARLVS